MDLARPENTFRPSRRVRTCSEPPMMRGAGGIAPPWCRRRIPPAPRIFQCRRKAVEPNGSHCLETSCAAHRAPPALFECGCGGGPPALASPTRARGQRAADAAYGALKVGLCASLMRILDPSRSSTLGTQRRSLDSSLAPRQVFGNLWFFALCERERRSFSSTARRGHA